MAAILRRGLSLMIKVVGLYGRNRKPQMAQILFMHSRGQAARADDFHTIVEESHT